MTDAGRARRQAALACLAVIGRDVGSLLPLPEQPLPDDEFDALAALAEPHRVIGALAEAVATGELAVTPRQHAVVAEHHARWMTQCLRAERLLLLVADCLGAHGIEARVLKGSALAHIVYADPAWRAFGDVDLLVPGPRIDEVAHLAEAELGGVRPYPELRPGFDREFGKDVLIRINGIELDIHRTFVTGPFGLTIPLEQLFASATPFVVGERTLHALGGEEMFLHACYNAALGDRPVRWGSQRDLLLVYERCHIDNDSVSAIAADWSATAVVQHAARLTMDTLRLGHQHALAALAALPVPAREARRLQSYLVRTRSYRRPLASLPVIKGMRARARYARALVAPSHAYLSSRGWTEGSHVRTSAPEPPGRWPCLSRCRAVSSSGTRLRCSGGWSTVCSFWARRRPFRRGSRHRATRCGPRLPSRARSLR